MTIGEYLVTGTRAYRGHEPGSTFEAILEPGPEGRAIARGDIQLLRRFTPSLQEGTYRLPPGWPQPANHEAPTGASSVAKGG